MKDKEYLAYISNLLQNPNIPHSKLHDIILEIEKNYSNSAVLQFFIGVIYHSRFNDLNKAENYYRKAIQVNPKFAHATFALAELTLTKNFVAAEKLLLDHVFDQYTYDPYIEQLYFQPLQTLRSFTLLANYYPLAVAKDAKHKILEKEQLDKAERLSKRIITLVKEETLPNNRTALHIEAIKLAYQTLARVYNKIDKGSSEPSFIQYIKGLEWNTNNLSTEDRKRHYEIDRALLEGAALSVNYFLPTKETPSFDWCYHVNRIYKSFNKIPTPRNKKIHIGYLSPDFNMNAVSLFVTALLKHHNPSNFKVFCYYTKPDCDQYTKMMMAWPNIEWSHITYQTDKAVYEKMTKEHTLDILVDLISLGASNRMPLIAMKPAPVIINYLGYPNKCYHKAVTHRIVDNITDPAPYASNKGETLIRLPGCFINFTLFENIRKPDIHFQSHALEEIRIGIFNKSAKYSKDILKIWLNILNKNPRIVFYIKQDERMHHDPTAWDAVAKLFPENRIRPLPIVEDLTSFYEQFNEVEFTLDTFPYSGTTTTCNSLYMGVPVLTIYDPKNPHVSNVSASILKHCQEPETYMCQTLEQYEKQALELAKNVPCKTINDRFERRNRFLKAMDPTIFMQHYEHLLHNLVR